MPCCQGRVAPKIPVGTVQGAHSWSAQCHVPRNVCIRCWSPRSNRGACWFVWVLMAGLPPSSWGCCSARLWFPGVLREARVQSDRQQYKTGPALFHLGPWKMRCGAGLGGHREVHSASEAAASWFLEHYVHPQLQRETRDPWTLHWLGQWRAKPLSTACQRLLGFCCHKALYKYKFSLSSL